MIEIKEKEKCCGCTACASACPARCITMEADEEGFSYPHIDSETCISCNRCEQVCPIASPVAQAPCSQQAFVLQANDCALLRESTSGGAFSLLAKLIFDLGGFVYGAGYDELGMPAHKCACSESGIAEMRGSKYVQSSLSGIFSDIRIKLNRGDRVLFTGLPCQVEGLLAFLGSKPEGLVTVDLVCHSVGSPHVYSLYRSALAKDGYVRFKDKRPYGYQYSQISVTDDSGRVVYRAGVESDAYMRSYFSNMNVRPSCYACAFKKRFRLSDITIWDCYNAHSFCGEIDDSRGASSVLCHSEIGQQLIESLKTDAVVKPVDTNDLLRLEWAFTKSVKKPAKRDAFFHDCAEAEDPVELFNTWFPVTWKVALERAVRRILSRLGLLGKFKNFVKGISR